MPEEMSGNIYAKIVFFQSDKPFTVFFLLSNHWNSTLFKESIIAELFTSDEIVMKKRISEIHIHEWYQEREVIQLITALKDGKPRIRLLASRALGNLKANIAIPYLIRTMNEEDKLVSFEAAWALLKIDQSPEIKKAATEKLSSLINAK